ncbi:MAG: right-handed parallel beta-helix repeat-containing protein [Proteobacteria bacterium]|nr:right-handed parallel beta-helix repeat-containing protein [Pseudomonadota bacterium]
MIRSLLVAIAVLGVAIDASAQEWLSESLYEYRHATAPAEATPSPDLRSLALPALGAEEPPCDGAPIEGEFVLDRDIACSVTLGSGATLDLNGFTIEGYVSSSFGSNATIKNGTVLRGGIWGNTFGCSSCTIENVQVIDSVSDAAVLAGYADRITGCFFSGNRVAVDLYWAGSTLIEDSTFENNDTGIYQDRYNSNIISSNVFRANRTGMRLYPYHGLFVSYNTIADNLFVDNEIGLAFTAGFCNGSPPSYGCMSRNTVIGNHFLENRGSGLLFDFSRCAQEHAECENVDASIEDNVFSGNGFEPAVYSPMDDGISVVGPLDVIDGFTFARNVAVSNSDLGIEAPGVTDGGGNRASGNGNPLQCVGVACIPAEKCRDGIDNDGDGLIDFPTDPGCASAASNIENPTCQDGIDNNRNGTIDFDGGASANHGVSLGQLDPQCTTPYAKEKRRACGLGAELALLLPSMWLAARRRRRAS